MATKGKKKRMAVSDLPSLEISKRSRSISPILDAAEELYALATALRPDRPTLEPAVLDRALVASLTPPQYQPVEHVNESEIIEHISVYLSAREQCLFVENSLLRSLAEGIHRERELKLLGVDPTRGNNYPDLYRSDPTGTLDVGEINYVPPSSDGMYDPQRILATQFGLRTHTIRSETKDASVFIDCFTASDLNRLQYTINQIYVNPDTGEIIRRPACFNGVPRDGELGCAMFQIAQTYTTYLGETDDDMSMGVFLNYTEAEQFITSGILPPNCHRRVCILCELNLYQCEHDLNNPQGIGQPTPELTIPDIFQKFRVLVGELDGYDVRHCFTDRPSLAPILRFLPHLLSIKRDPDGRRYVCDDQLHWMPPAETPDFQ